LLALAVTVIVVSEGTAASTAPSALAVGSTSYRADLSAAAAAAGSDVVAERMVVACLIDSTRQRHCSDPQTMPTCQELKNP
jgi:hypothetical protein